MKPFFHLEGLASPGFLARPHLGELRTLLPTPQAALISGSSSILLCTLILRHLGCAPPTVKEQL